MKKQVIGSGLVAVVGIIALSASGSSNSGSSNAAPGVTASSGGHPATADATITKCGMDTTFGSATPQATVAITNHSSSESNYIVTVAFNSPDGKTQYDTGIASADNLGTGQSTTDTADSTKSGIPADFVCKIVDVTRYASASNG